MFCGYPGVGNCNVLERLLTGDLLRQQISPKPGSCDREDPDETTTGVEMCSLDLKGDGGHPVFLFFFTGRQLNQEKRVGDEMDFNYVGW